MSIHPVSLMATCLWDEAQALPKVLCEGALCIPLILYHPRCPPAQLLTPATPAIFSSQKGPESALRLYLHSSLDCTLFNPSSSSCWSSSFRVSGADPSLGLPSAWLSLQCALGQQSPTDDP